MNTGTANFALDLFNFHADDGTLTSEASILEDRFGTLISITSHHTKRTVTFKHVSTSRRSDEVIAWNYIPAEAKNADDGVDAGKVKRVRIWND